MNVFPSTQQIALSLREIYGIDTEWIIPLTECADWNSAIYHVKTPIQKSYFVKLKKNYDVVNISLTEQLSSAGIQEVILPIKTYQGRSYHYISDFMLIVYPFIKGQNGFKQPLSNPQWLNLGTALKRIHELELPIAIQNALRKEEYCPKWRDAVKGVIKRLEKETFTDSISIRVAEFIHTHSDDIARLVNGAEILAVMVQKEQIPFVLCHSDIHAGNVLITENNQLYIVDWDEPMMAPKERDLMFIGGGVANVWNKFEEEALFYKGYGNRDINLKLLAYYRYERIVVDIAEYAQFLLYDHFKEIERQEMYEQFVGMFDKNGVVDIAFATGNRIDNFF